MAVHLCRVGRIEETSIDGGASLSGRTDRGGSRPSQELYTVGSQRARHATIE